MALTPQRIDAILDALPTVNPGLSAGTLAQVRRWGQPFLEWCAAAGVRPTADDDTLLARYERAHPERFGTSAAAVRSQLRKVLRAADASLPRPRGSGGRYTAKLRELPERGRLTAAARAVEARAKTGSQRRQQRCLLGRFLVWCEERGIRPEDCCEADLVAYRRARQRDGANSTGADVYAAKLLLVELGVVVPTRR